MLQQSYHSMQLKKIKKKANHDSKGHLDRSKKRLLNTDPSSSLINSNPFYKQMMVDPYEPIPISGPKAAGPNSVPEDRKVVWKKVCLIQDNSGMPYVVHPQADLETSLAMHHTHFQTLNNSVDRSQKRHNIETRECIIEISRTKVKFYIVAVDLLTFKYHVVEMFRHQANKMIKAVDNNLQTLVSFLEFRYGTLCIKD